MPEQPHLVNDAGDAVGTTDRAVPIAAHDPRIIAQAVHRVRFTSDTFNPSNETLARAFTPVDPTPGDRNDDAFRSNLAVLIDSNVAAAWPTLERDARLYLELMGERGPMLRTWHTIPGGEHCKNDPAVLADTLRVLHDARLCRRSYVLAIGGGAVLDVAGFAAAITHRGVRLIRMPTTTLAQADSGIGVKNGINAFGKKNFLGTFAVPWAVINDETFLATLEPRDGRAGLSECVKVALLKDEALFERIEGDAPRLRERNADAAVPIIQRSAELHLRHIAGGGDPFEQGASRPLDFGHWAAHKLEQLTDFEMRHGEAVAIGIAIDTAYAARVGLLGPAIAARVHACLRALGFNLHHAAMRDTHALLAGLEEFREHLGGELTVTLLRGIGEPLDVHTIDHAAMAETIDALR